MKAFFFSFILLYNITLSHSINKDDEKYLFFLHNRFLETHELNEVHPTYGKVEYSKMITLFQKNGFNVVSEQRKGNVNAQNYALGIVNQINHLIKQGVKARNITVVGTSKGGYIAQYVSTLAENPKLNFVFIGCFRDSDITTIPEINFCGNILTIFEKTDPYGVSAIERKNKSTCSIPHFKEIQLNTGKKHGFLFKSLPEWTNPTIKWAKGIYK